MKVRSNNTHSHTLTKLIFSTCIHNMYNTYHIEDCSRFLGFKRFYHLKHINHSLCFATFYGGHYGTKHATTTNGVTVYVRWTNKQTKKQTNKQREKRDKQTNRQIVGKQYRKQFLKLMLNIEPTGSEQLLGCFQFSFEQL